MNRFVQRDIQSQKNFSIFAFVFDCINLKYININNVDAKDSRLFATITETMKIFPEGINSVTIGEKISYLLKLNEMFTLHNYTTDISKKNENNLSMYLVI